MPARVAAVATWFVGAVLALLVVSALVIQTPWFHDWARVQAERLASRLLRGDLTIGRLDGNLLTGVTLHDVRIRQDGRDVLVAERVAVRYAIRRVITNRIAIDEVRLIHPAITLVETEGGWNVASLLEPPAPGTPPGDRTVAIDAIDIDEGLVRVERFQSPDRHPAVRIPEHLAHVAARMSFVTGPNDLRVSVRNASFEARKPALPVRELSGDFERRDGRFDVHRFTVRTDRSRVHGEASYDPSVAPARVTTGAEAAPVDFEEWAGLIPALAGFRLAPTITIDAAGQLDALRLTLAAEDKRAGSVAVDLVADVDGRTRRARGSVKTRSLDLEPLLNDARLRSSLTAMLNLDVTAPAGSLSFDDLEGRYDVSGHDLAVGGYRADRLKAQGRIADGRIDIRGTAGGYGTAITSAATISYSPGRTTYKASGRVAGLDLRRLPRQIDAPALETRLNFQYSVTGVDARDARPRGTLRLDRSAVEGTDISKGATARFSLEGDRPSYAFEGSVAHLDLARIGSAVPVPALDDPRFKSDLSGTFAFEGSGTHINDLNLRAQGELTPSTIFDAALPLLSFDATIAGDRLKLVSRGEVRGLRLDRLDAARGLEGEINGSLDVDGWFAGLSTPPTLDSFGGRARAALTASTIRGIQIDRADLAGSYDDRFAQVEALRVTGPAIELTASGPVSLGAGHDSDLNYSAEIARLEDFGPLVGHMLSGSGRFKGQVKGHGEQLSVSGPLSLNRFRYDEVVDVLVVDGTYSLEMPDLDLARMSAVADVDATLLTLQGRELTSASIKVGYTKPALTFDGTFRAGPRTAVARGVATREPERQRIRVERLALGNDDLVWSNPLGEVVNVDYDRGVATLHDVQLTSGSQRLSMNGTLPFGGDTAGRLDVTAEGVDLGRLGELLLVERKLKGRLSASAAVTGPASARVARGEATVEDGAIDDLKFQSVVAKVEYLDQVIHLDATLHQSPEAYLTVAGTIPASTGGSSGPAPKEVDLHIESTSVSLAVVQTVTTRLNDVSGVLEMNLDVSGTLAAPRVEGRLAIKDGAFEVAESGARYRKLDAALSFGGVTATVDRLSVLDDDGHSMTATARVGIEGRRIGAIDAELKALDFQVLDNELGNVALNASLAVQGTVDAPRVTGLVSVESGRVEIDSVLDKLTANPYQTTPARAAAEAPPAEDGPFANLVLDLTVHVPNNLVLRGSDIRSNSGPALGDVNITVGGMLDVRKGRGKETNLIGSVNTVRGSYDFQRRRFAVRRDGRIEFHGLHPVDPELDLAADREVAGVVAHVEITGTARSPRLHLSSDPPMEETDILSLIVFNQPASQLGEGERISLGERAAVLAGSAVVGVITESLGRALNLSVFMVETVSEAGGAPMVTVGKQVGSRLFVRLRQLFGAQDVSDLLLEYELADYLRLQGTVSEGQGLANRSFTRRVERGGLDVVLFLRY